MSFQRYFYVLLLIFNQYLFNISAISYLNSLLISNSFQCKLRATTKKIHRNQKLRTHIPTQYTCHNLLIQFWIQFHEVTKHNSHSESDLKHQTPNSNQNLMHRSEKTMRSWGLCVPEDSCTDRHRRKSCWWRLAKRTWKKYSRPLKDLERRSSIADLSFSSLCRPVEYRRQPFSNILVRVLGFRFRCFGSWIRVETEME